eukprot:CAMPEP_0203824504 /NCGR_PEP_ID=MMETSP0115-20131106/51925_1 /ASSEMBLY_ACC=CAM_ASM_000227 /TAXON_ID=33651 /ORGANISM="Bicosoecid sp, Strain ms1" /LENGTH=262 /DNA_ID=CAMNT_0050733545 /DNA_START=69 /DNA_END=854 /DNA_ORIENTATION=+
MAASVAPAVAVPAEKDGKAAATDDRKLVDAKKEHSLSSGALFLSVTGVKKAQMKAMKRTASGSGVKGLFGKQAKTVEAYAGSAKIAKRWQQAAASVRDPWKALVSGNSRIVHAARRGNLKTVMGLVENGVPVDTVLARCDDEDPCGQSALIKAVRFGHHATAHFLLSRGASTELRDSVGRDAWFYAAFSLDMQQGGHAGMVRLLLAHVSEVPSRVFQIAAHAAPETGVCELVCDSIPRRVVSRTATGLTTVVFDNLHLLDDR